jgi:hypothetical protein
LEDLLCNTVQTKARSIIACSLLENSAPIVYTMLIVRITEYNPIFRLHAVTSFFPLNGCICNQYRVCYVVYLLLVCSVLYILFKTFVLFLWSFCFLYRLIVCTLLMRFNGFKLVWWYLYTFFFSYCNTAFFSFLSFLLHFYTSGTLFQIPIYNNRRLYVVDRVLVQIILTT